MLEIIMNSLKEMSVVENITGQVSDQVYNSVLRLDESHWGETLPASEIMKRLGLFHRPAFGKNYLQSLDAKQSLMMLTSNTGRNEWNTSRG